ncbi:MAG: efflux RND transporter periplasmic adaptor subunit [Gammaproteobacteria bacterium]|nr:efflux RND transporter periplasmic adaptor subunit [Gammaproteobacteria bacterium]
MVCPSTSRLPSPYRFVLPAALASLFSLGVQGAFAADAPAAAPPPAVTVAKPAFKEVTEWDEYTGRFVAQQRVDVRARVSGYLQEVVLSEGHMVEEGQVLFRIDPEPFEAEVARAEAKVARASTTLKVAELEFERGERLASSKAMSRETMEERRANRDAAKADVEAARAELRLARLNLDYTEVRAPISGLASDVRVDRGNLISGGSADSTVLTTILKLDPIELEIEASESEFLRYSRLETAGTRQSSRNIANPVEAMLIDEDEWAHKGQMTFVDNEIDVNTATMRGRATFANPGHVLLPGMFARVRLLGAGAHEAILVPEEAIVADQARKLLMVVGKDNIIEARPVVLGPMIDGLRLIREGLAPEESIVVNGVQRAHPGKPVTPQEASAPR